MSWLGLKHKGVEILYPEEWNLVVDGLDLLKHYADESLRISSLTSLPSDIIPDQDNVRRLGDPSRSWSEVNAYYGYFREEVYVKGRKVIKDQDPIFIADIYEEARTKITYAVNESKVGDIYLKILDIVGKLDVRISEVKASVDDVYQAILDLPNRMNERVSEQVYSAKEITANDSVDFTVESRDKYSALIVTVRATYNASATAGVRIRWLYSPDGSNFDSPKDAESAGNYEDLTFEKGKTRQRTVVVPLFTPYVKVEIVNLDTSYSVIVDVWKTLMR